MFDRAALIEACREHDRVARVVIADVKGSAPREVGASMLIWQGGQSGTIGGGTLEYELAQKALHGGDQMSRHALGPDMGQCCGGVVHVLSEIYDLARAEALPEDVIIHGQGEKPLAVQRHLAQIRNAKATVQAQRFGDWFVEPVYKPAHDLWIWGAGHVGRALVDVMAPLSAFQITWVDTDPSRFPTDVPKNVRCFPLARPHEGLSYAPTNAHHLILTYSHALDLELCSGVLSRGFSSCGLIGSATKWARFKKRLEQLSHTKSQIEGIQCPIGTEKLGKSPQSIAIGVAYQLMDNLMPIENNQTKFQGGTLA